MENELTMTVSTQSTRTPGGFLQRAAWTLCLMAIGSVLAIHAALAYSPELARFVPERLVKSPASTSSKMCPSFLNGGCSTSGLSAGDFGGGCCSMRAVERPCLTDGLYQEDDPLGTFAEGPADALNCVPEKSTAEDSVPEVADPQASVDATQAELATSKN